MDEKEFVVVLKGAEGALANVGDVKARHDAESKRIADDRMLSNVGKQEKLAALAGPFSQLVKDTRSRVLPTLDESLTWLDDEEKAVHRAASFEPRGAEAWTEANARRAFFKEDAEFLAANSPSEIVARYQNALNGHDEISIYFYERYGTLALRKVGAERSANQLDLLARKAHDERLDHAALEKIAERRNKVAELKRKLSASMSSDDEAKIAQRFNLGSGSGARTTPPEFMSGRRVG